MSPAIETALKDAELALPVLRNVLKRIGLKTGVEAAEQMIERNQQALKELHSHE